MRLLILSITTGQGHHQTGLAISHFFEKNGHQVTRLDCYEYLSPPVKEMISNGYLVSTKYSPKLYGKMYRLAEKTDTKEINSMLFQIPNTLFHHKMVKYLEEINPDCIICTHVFAALLITYLMEKGTKYPTIGVITDFKMHPYWVATNLDYYVTPNEYITPSLLKKGIPKEKILPFGIPIFDKFSKKEKKEDVRKELGLSNISTILVMSGSMGFGNVTKLIKVIDSIPMDFQMITVCGKNERLYQRIEKHKFSHPIQNFGFVNNVDKLMDASDCIITKPGGLTISEALAKELPMLISKPIPGQEERNLEFLLNFGCCMQISKTSPVDEVISQLFMNPKKQELMLENIRLLKKPDAAEKLYEHIIKVYLTENKKEKL